MAKSNNNIALYLNLLLCISLILIINMAESKLLPFGIGHEKAKAKPLEATCQSLYGAQEGDTCSTVSQEFGLTSDFFLEINPNINCEDIFVGQWLCVIGVPVF